MSRQLNLNEEVSYSDHYGLTPAMITALFYKPNDRQFVIALETSVVSFINSSAESCELAPMNSYFRLLSHQIAEYHNLKHALARTHDNCVIIFKGNDFVKMDNRPLLQSLRSPVSTEPRMAHEFTAHEDSLKEAIKSKNNKKYKILKRTEGNGGTATPSIDAASAQEEEESRQDSSLSEATLEEKRIERERKYEQRKQEIFDMSKIGEQEDLTDDDPEGHSPQPRQFETSRFRLMHTENQPPPALRYNRRRKGYNSHTYATTAPQHYNHDGDKNVFFNYNATLTNKGVPAPYMTMAPYMVYPPPSVANGTLGIYPTHAPIYAPDIDSEANAKQNFSEPYMSYINPIQLPFQYNQAAGFPPNPLYYGVYMPNYPPSDIDFRRQSHPPLNNMKSASSISSTQSSESFRRTTSSLLDKSSETNRSNTDVEQISNDIKELSV